MRNCIENRKRRKKLRFGGKSKKNLTKTGKNVGKIIEKKRKKMANQIMANAKLRKKFGKH